MTEEIISTVNYDDSNPVYQKIKREFTNKLKEKYQCEDYNSIVNYVFDYVFKKKSTKSECYKNLNEVFNNKPNQMIDYLWKITREAENNEESVEDDSNHNNRGKNWRKDRKRFNREGKYNKGIRDRSRSYSKERPSSKYDHENYPNYLPMKGFYAPKGRFGAPMMPMGGAYPPPYMMRPMMKR